MESNQDFEKYIRNSLSTIDKEPKSEVWDKIEQTLDAKKKRKILPFKLASFGFLILMVLYFGNEFIAEYKMQKLNVNTKINNPATGAEDTIDDKKNNTNVKSILDNEDGNELNNQVKKNSTIISKVAGGSMKKEKISLPLNESEKNKNRKKSGSKKNIYSKPLINVTTGIDDKTDTSSDTNNFDLNNYRTANEIGTKNNPLSLKDTTNKKLLAKLPLKENENDIKKDSIKEHIKVWSVSLYAAPTIYGTFSNHSILDQKLEKNHDRSQLVWGYGGYINIVFNKKVGMRFGLLHSKVEIKTQNIPIYDSSGNVTQFNQFSNLKSDFGLTNQSIADYFSNDERINFLSEITYNEVPFEFRYRLLDHKFQVDGMGGFGCLIISQNKVTAYNEEQRRLSIGSLSNFDRLLFTGTIGLSTSYPLAKDLRIFVNPSFNYQFAEFKSYGFIVRSGFTFRF